MSKLTEFLNLKQQARQQTGLVAIPKPKTQTVKVDLPAISGTLGKIDDLLKETKRQEEIAEIVKKGFAEMKIVDIQSFSGVRMIMIDKGFDYEKRRKYIRRICECGDPACDIGSFTFVYGQ